MKTKQKQQQKQKKPAKNEQPGFDQRMLGKFVSMQQANIRKGKCNNKNNVKTEIIMFSQKGVDGQKTKKKWISEREEKENQERKQNRKQRRILKTGLSGEQN